MNDIETKIEELIDEMISAINNIPFKFDLYISTNTLEKKNSNGGLSLKKNLHKDILKMN